jgi:hypothetical protein
VAAPVTDLIAQLSNDGANWVGVLFASCSRFAALAVIAVPFLARTWGVALGTWSICHSVDWG